MDFTDYIRAIIEFYSSLGKDKVFCNLKNLNGNSEKKVYDRLVRAVFDQRDENNVATYSRYVIWVDDIRYLIKSAMEAIETEESDKAIEQLTLALNVMGAFADIQRLFDTQPGRMQFSDPDDILHEYEEFRSGE